MLFLDRHLTVSRLMFVYLAKEEEEEEMIERKRTARGLYRRPLPYYSSHNGDEGRLGERRRFDVRRETSDELDQGQGVVHSYHDQYDSKKSLLGTNLMVMSAFISLSCSSRPQPQRPLGRIVPLMAWLTRRQQKPWHLQYKGTKAFRIRLKPRLRSATPHIQP